MGTVRISVVSDVVCPWCYIGVRRLDQALLLRPDHQFELRWLPFELHPYLPPEGIAKHILFKRKFAGRGGAIVQRVVDAGANVDIAFNFDAIETIPNTVAAHCALSWAEADGNDVDNRLARAIFAAGFEQGRDVGDHTVLADLCRDVGVDRATVKDKLDNGTDREEVHRAADLNRARGIVGVPHFFVNDAFPIPGAQEPDTILHVIDAAIAKAR